MIINELVLPLSLYCFLTALICEHFFFFPVSFKAFTFTNAASDPASGSENYGFPNSLGRLRTHVPISFSENTPIKTPPVSQDDSKTVDVGKYDLATINVAENDAGTFDIPEKDSTNIGVTENDAGPFDVPKKDLTTIVVPDNVYSKFFVEHEVDGLKKAQISLKVLYGPRRKQDRIAGDVSLSLDALIICDHEAIRPIRELVKSVDQNVLDYLRMTDDDRVIRDDLDMGYSCEDLIKYLRNWNLKFTTPADRVLLEKNIPVVYALLTYAMKLCDEITKKFNGCLIKSTSTINLRDSYKNYYLPLGSVPAIGVPKDACSSFSVQTGGFSPESPQISLVVMHGPKRKHEWIVGDVLLCLVTCILCNGEDISLICNLVKSVQQDFVEYIRMIDNDGLIRDDLDMGYSCKDLIKYLEKENLKFTTLGDRVLLEKKISVVYALLTYAKMLCNKITKKFNGCLIESSSYMKLRDSYEEHYLPPGSLPGIGVPGYVHSKFFVQAERFSHKSPQISLMVMCSSQRKNGRIVGAASLSLVACIVCNREDIYLIRGLVVSVHQDFRDYLRMTDKNGVLRDDHDMGYSCQDLIKYLEKENLKFTTFAEHVSLRRNIWVVYAALTYAKKLCIEITKKFNCHLAESQSTIKLRDSYKEHELLLGSVPRSTTT